jgi:hypothetical protein
MLDKIMYEAGKNDMLNNYCSQFYHPFMNRYDN